MRGTGKRDAGGTVGGVGWRGEAGIPQADHGVVAGAGQEGAVGVVGDASPLRSSQQGRCLQLRNHVMVCKRTFCLGPVGCWP